MKRGDLVEFHGFECEVVELYLNKVKIRRISDRKEKIVSRSVVKLKKIVLSLFTFHKIENLG